MSTVPRLDAYTGHLIRRAQQLHNTLWLRIVSQRISSVQYAVLTILEHKPGINQNELGSDLDLDRSTITDIITRMLKHGLISRKQDLADRRRNILNNTAAGRAELVALTPKVIELNKIIVEDLAADEVDNLQRLLNLILQSHSSN